MEQWLEEVQGGALDHETMTGRYYAVVYAGCGSYEAAAQKLGTDWRTVKTRLDKDFLGLLRGG
jgi:hypothetical protein